ncbi:LOW QUALITY PROTEIN: phosphatidate cytidylyltransferase [Vibrio sp. JCM 18904]|nr:LOW QUALITY PROTEIN: phosphatidate cytidylyltransferase [Vibrio sp. JCM 18904]
MKQRIITALILAPLVILGIFKLPLMGFIAALTAITLLGFWEWTQFTGSNSRIAALVPAIIITGLSFLYISPDAYSLNHLTTPHYVVLGIGFVWWIIASLMAITYPPKTTKSWQSNFVLRHVFGFLTLIPFLWSVIILRAYDITVDPYHGAKLVLYVCFLVWAADSGAYFAGKSANVRWLLMAPPIKPLKLIGGIITALIVAWAFADWFDIQFTSPVHMVLITLVTVVISVLGDLVESMFKRVSGIKDSSNIIPGHGGVLDRIDSLTAAFPVFALLYYVF